MYQWDKLGLIFNPALEKDRPEWRWNFAQGENALIFDDFVRVYFCTREKPNEQGQTVSRVAFVDLDRKNLKNVVRVSQNPVLELGGTGAFDEFGTYPFCPVRVNDLIYGYYGGVTRCESVPFNVAIGLGISDDQGLTFKKLDHGPILSYSLDEPFVVCSPKVRFFQGQYYMFYSSGTQWIKTDGRPEICYKLRMAVSKDGINWEKLHKNIIADKLGEDEAQACGDVIFKNGAYHMFFCYRKSLDFRRNKENTYKIGYARSKDLIHWERNDEQAGIRISEKGDDFDSEMVAYPNVFELDGNIYMLYLGNEVGKMGFGLAKLKGEL
jgi:predicted GH43/DUF377 family glycosyl hydrolase